VGSGQSVLWFPADKILDGSPLATWLIQVPAKENEAGQPSGAADGLDQGMVVAAGSCADEGVFVLDRKRRMAFHIDPDAAVLQAPGLLPGGMDRFALDEDVLLGFVRWLCGHADQANRREEYGDWLIEGKPDWHEFSFGMYLTRKNHLVTLEVHDLQAWADTHEQTARDLGVWDALVESDGITGLTRTRGGVKFAYGLNVGLALNGPYFARVKPGGACSRVHEWSPAEAEDAPPEEATPVRAEPVAAPAQAPASRLNPNAKEFVPGVAYE
jgi:hypothetical protein